MAIENQVPLTWIGCPGGMLMSPQLMGGIIDSRIVDGKWFVIFNDSREPLEDFATREAAIMAYITSTQATYYADNPGTYYVNNE